MIVIEGSCDGVWRMLKTVSLIAVVMVTVTRGSPIESKTDAMSYLARYGYVAPNIGSRFGDSMVQGKFKEALLEFQKLAGLKTTGHFDKSTRLQMNKGRCGFKDRLSEKLASLTSDRWTVNDLKYRISVYPNDPSVPRHRVDTEVKRAFQVWSEHTDLTFTPATSRDVKVHIDIRFAVGEHGDGSAFDGPGGTLAHAFFPSSGGDTHFDETETWTLEGEYGTNLFQVAAHEFGHALGLSHSEVHTAVMAPFYSGYDPQYRLQPDDIQRIQALYPAKSAPASTTRRPRAPTEPPRNSPDIRLLCQDGDFDTIFSTNGFVYVFKGDLYWRLSTTGFSSGYPKSIATGWPGLPGNLDAAFAFTNKNQTKTYFFKGHLYWRYTGSRLDKTYPRRIAEGFKGIPDNIDTAFVWSLNNEMYFFKDQVYWRFNPYEQPAVQKDYPRLIAQWWRNVPNDIGAALTHPDGHTYFFKKGQYYQFNDEYIAVERNVAPPYPHPTSPRWFGCPSTLPHHKMASQPPQAVQKGEKRGFTEPKLTTKRRKCKKRDREENVKPSATPCRWTKMNKKFI